MFTVFESSFRSLRCFSLAFASSSLFSYSHYFSVSFSSFLLCWLWLWLSDRKLYRSQIYKKRQESFETEGAFCKTGQS